MIWWVLVVVVVAAALAWAWWSSGRSRKTFPGVDRRRVEGELLRKHGRDGGWGGSGT